MKLTNDCKEQKVSFLGKRTDRNLVNELTDDNGALYKPKQRVISEAISRLGQNGSSDNINFLFSVAENLNYGLKKDSELSSFVDKKSNITNVIKKQNNDWEGQLKGALTSAISKNTTPEAKEFKEKFDAMFSKEVEEKTSNNIPNAQIPTQILKQRELISLRNDILKSDVLDTVPEKFNEEEKNDLRKDKNSLNRNLDYFVASSEVPMGEKIECLKIIKHITTPEYKINPQLQDYKVKVLSEIVDDIVVENPNQKRLTTKDVAQRTHGMCAAISISRKAMPHEHKLAFVSTIAAELDENDSLDVYDVTSPNLAEKSRVKKADIDYTQSNREGYRITDAAVTNWMHIGDTYGDGTRHFKWFKPFDKENYGMFRDTHLSNDLEGDNKSKQYTLRALTKLWEKGEEIKQIKKDYAGAVSERKVVDDNLVETSAKVHSNVADVVKNLSGVSDEKAHEVAKNILDEEHLNKIRKPFIKQYTDEENIQNAKDILTSELGVKDSTKLDEAADKYIDNYMSLANAKAEKYNNSKKLNKYSTENLQKIFDYAAYTRVKTEFQLEVPDELKKKAEEYGIDSTGDPAEVKAVVLKKMENQQLIFKRKDLDEIKENIYDKVNLERDSMQKNDRAAEKAAHKMKICTPHQEEMLKNVEKTFNKQNKQVEKEYLQYREELAPELEKNYADSKYGGNFWALEDGKSGLNGAQQIRIIEQMSGKEHHSEKNAARAMDKIANAGGGSILSSSVSDTDAAFHAQYVYDVHSKKSLNPETNEPEEQRVLYTDNSWGSSEKRTSANPKMGRTYWTDAEGNQRTDYGRNLGGEFGDKGGFGYKKGFFLDDNYTIGVSEDDMLSGNLNLKKGSGSKAKEIKMPVFSEIILRGNDAEKTDFETFKVQELLFSVLNQKSVRDVNALTQVIKTGNSEDIACLSKDLKNVMLPNVHKYLSKSDEDLAKSLHKDINKVVVAYPTHIFKPENGESIPRPDKFEDSIVEKLTTTLKQAKQNNQDNIATECFVANRFSKVLDDEIESKTTPIFKPKYNEFETVKDRYKSEAKDTFDRLKDSNPEKVITEEKFESMPEDSSIKMKVKKGAWFEKMYDLELGLLSENSKLVDAVGFADVDYGNSQDGLSNNKEKKVKGLSLDHIRDIADKVVTAQNSKDLESLKGDFRDLTEEQILLGMDKSMLQKINKVPTNMEELKAAPSGKKVIEFIDAKYDPENDEELMGEYNRLLDMPKEEQVKLLKSSTDEEVGYKAPDCYNFIKRVRGSESSAEDSLQSVIIYDVMAKEFNLKSPFKEGTSKADKLFISLSNSMAYAELGNTIQGMKKGVLKDMHIYPAIPNIKAFHQDEIDSDNKDMLNQLTEVVDKIHDYKKSEISAKGNDALEIKEELKQEKQILRDKAKIVANGCIQPKHVDLVLSKMNTYFALKGENPDSEKTKNAEESLLKSMSDYHISRKPQQLFTSFVKDLTEENDYGSSETRDNVIQLKSVFLSRVCNSSDKAKLQLELMMTAQQGNMNAVSRNLKTTRFGISQVGKKEALTWHDPRGIGLAVTQLRDEKNNNETLKHFLLTTGMVSDAVDGFVKGPSPSKHFERVSKMKEILDSHIAEQAVILQKHDEFISSKLTPEQKSTRNIDEVKEITKDYLNSVLPEGKIKSGSAAAEYKERIEERLEFNDTMGIRDTAEEFLKGMGKELVDSQEPAKEDTIEKIIMHQNILGEKISTLEVIASMLNPGDPQKIEAENYAKNATEVVQQMEKMKDSFQQDILDRIEKEAEAQKASNQRRNQAMTAINSVDEGKKPSKSELDTQKQKAEADAMYDDFVAIQKTNEKTGIQIATYQIINSENPEITKHLIDNMNDESGTSLSRAYAVNCLIHKNELEALKDYAEPRLMSDDPSKLDDTTINCVDGLIVASIVKPDEEKKPYLDLVSRALNIACDKDYKSDKAYPLMSQLRNSLANKSSEINDMLVKNVFDKNKDENTRAISMDILSRSGSGEFKPLMEDIVVNTNKYAKNPSEAFTFFDVSLLGLKNIKMATVNTETNIKDYLKNLDIKKIVDSGFSEDVENTDKKADVEEAKAAKEADFKQRIDFILKEKESEDKKDEENSESAINKKPIEMGGKFNPTSEYLQFVNKNSWGL